MVSSPMVYAPQGHDLVAHFKGIAAGTGLPIMLYNSPPAYRATIDATLEDLRPQFAAASAG